jgi:hypothetical protein
MAYQPLDGAAGKQTLDKWDPSGYYIDHGCIYNGLPLVDPECPYDRAKRDLENSGFSENQVQAIFIKTANSYPQCDLSGGHGASRIRLRYFPVAEESRLAAVLSTSHNNLPSTDRIFWEGKCALSFSITWRKASLLSGPLTRNITNVA